MSARWISAFTKTLTEPFISLVAYRLSTSLSYDLTPEIVYF